MPGASVARIARAHGVNANQVFSWRKLYQQGALEVEPNAAALVPVRIAEADTHNESTPEARPSARSGVIEIEFRNARLRIEGSPDPAAVRLALECLRG